MKICCKEHSQISEDAIEFKVITTASFHYFYVDIASGRNILPLA